LGEKITEKISYLTQIHTAWNGTEQRMALRNEARRYLSYDYTGMESWQSQYLRMLIYSAQTQLIQFPLWHAGWNLREQQYKGQASIQISTEAMWPFRNVGAVELWLGDKPGGAKYDLKYLTGNGVLGLMKQLKADWYRGSTILPVVYGILQQDDSFTNIHSDSSEMTINLELIQNQNAPDFPSAWDEYHDEPMPYQSRFIQDLPSSYMGSEVWRFYSQWEDDMSAQFTRNANRLDYNVGVFRFDLKSYNPTESCTMDFAAFSRAEAYNMQRFFMRHKGRWQSFWAPTWLNDIELQGDQPSGRIYLLANFTGFWKYYQKSSRRKTIVVFYCDGTCEILKIAGYSLDDTGTYGKIYLDSPLMHDIRKARVRLVSFFCRYRFSSDDLVTDYETNEIATMQIGFQEVDA
jgi:hypothetical protein